MALSYLISLKDGLSANATKMSWALTWSTTYRSPGAPPFSPVPPGRGNYTVERYEFILRNIPPTQLWLYRRPA